jgi:methyl-accepting chemotaxis protein
MNEPQELEKTGTAYAAKAVECEKQGDLEKAISLYQKASECLTQLMQRFPNYGFTNIYIDRARIYEERVKALTQSLLKVEPKKASPQSRTEPLDKPKEEIRSISIDLTPFNAILQDIKQKLNEISDSKNQSAPAVDNTPVLQEINGKLDDLSASKNEDAAAAPNTDMAPALQEINKKLDELAACITELKNQASVIQVNVNDSIGKSEQTQKELGELRNLVYSIKYDR